MRFLNADLVRSSSNRIKAAIVGLGVVAAYLLGLAIPARGVGALALPFLASGGFLVLLQPVLGLLLIAGTLPIENAIAVLSGEETVIRALALFVGGVWLARKLARRESWQPLVSTTLFKATALFLGLVLASFIWARDQDATVNGLSQLLRLLLWCLLVMDLAVSWKRLDWLAKALVLGACVASILTLRQFYLEGYRRAGEDIAGGGNGTAAVLTMIVPFAFYLARSQAGRLWRLVGALYIVLAPVAVAVTFSRMSYVMFSLVILVHVWDVIGIHWSRRWSFFVIGVALVVALAVVPWDPLVERSETIVPYLQETVGAESADPSVVAGRAYLLRVGLVMFGDNPLHGVGYANYRAAFESYASRVPDAARLFGTRSSSHSGHIAILAELGLAGFGLWVGILGVSFRNLALALSKLKVAADSRRFLLARAVMYSFLLALAYGWTINIQGEKLLWLFLGLSVAIPRLAASQSEHSSDAS